MILSEVRNQPGRCSENFFKFWMKQFDIRPLRTTIILKENKITLLPPHILKGTLCRADATVYVDRNQKEIPQRNQNVRQGFGQICHQEFIHD